LPVLFFAGALFGLDLFPTLAPPEKTQEDAKAALKKAFSEPASKESKEAKA